jgi:hypothetical protein
LVNAPLRWFFSVGQSSASKLQTAHRSCLGGMKVWGKAVFSLMHRPCFHDRVMWSREFFLFEKHVPHMMHMLVGQSLESHVRCPWFASLLKR